MYIKHISVYINNDITHIYIYTYLYLSVYEIFPNGFGWPIKFGQISEVRRWHFQRCAELSRRLSKQSARDEATGPQGVNSACVEPMMKF